MDDEKFWWLIAQLGPELRTGRLEMALSTLPWYETFAFTRQLRRAADMLDTALHRLHSWSASTHSLSSAGPETATSSQPTAVPLSPDEFDDLTVTIVALGREAWTAVLYSPTLLAASWPVEVGRQLITSATDALAGSVTTTLTAYAHSDRSRLVAAN